MKHFLLGCDWGTSSFRLRLINQHTHQLIGEVSSSDGVAATFTDWQIQGDSTDRAQFFRTRLQQQLTRLANKLALDIRGVPIVISGMASSSIGMDEVPYANLPFPTDGSQASIKWLPKQVEFPHDIILIGGIQSPHDVMRGEETQLIGLLALLDAQGVTVDESILIFPGTHSKHVFVKHGRVTNFQTFMTGELFSLMANHSILKDSLTLTGLDLFADHEASAFRLGIQEARSSSLLNSLFRVRTNQLFERLSKPQNAFFLSGLLIGTELQTLLAQPTWKLILCSDNPLFDLYTVALQELHLSDRVTPCSAGLLDKATLVGQVKIMQNQLLAISQ